MAIQLTKNHATHLGPALFGAGLITRKVRVSIDAQVGLHSMLEAFIAIGLSEPFSSSSKYYNKLLITALTLDYTGCSSYSIE